MPITQARMLSLIASASDYHQALTTLCEQIRQSSIRAQHSPDLSRDLLLDLTTIADPSTLLRTPVESQVTLQLESSHFKRNERRNNRIRLKQAHKRRAIQDAFDAYSDQPDDDPDFFPDSSKTQEQPK